MLPVLQAAYLQDRETSLFYVAVLCELLENLSKVFCMTHYKQMHAHNENDFPYAFFPPTEEFYNENTAFYRQEGGGGSGGSGGMGVDSLDDVMSAYTSVLQLRPEFAHTFWPSTQSHDIEAQMAAAGTAHHDIPDHFSHPFVMKAVDASFHHPSLMISAIRFVAALSASPMGRTAYAGFLFVQDSRHQRFSWEHFFEGMDKIGAQLGASMLASGQRFGGWGGYQSYLAESTQVVVRGAAHLGEKDEEGLVAIVQLLAAVSVHPSVAGLLREQYRPVPRLFALLSCALPITLKGAILQTLAVFARGSSSASEEIWELVEAHRLLPITHSSAPTASGANGQGYGYGGYGAGASAQTGQAFGSGGRGGRGLRVELEEAESRAGAYPITEGFLRLLDALLSHGTPDNALGFGYRRPGLMVYLDYVLEAVLLKAHERHYAPADWPSACAQRWRITAYALTVLCTLLQHYPLNAIPADSVAAAEALLIGGEQDALREAVADFREDTMVYTAEGMTDPQRCLRPKTAAFVVMSLLLGKSRLFDYLGFLLSECSAQNLADAFNEHCLSEVGAVVDLLQRLHQQAHPEAAAKPENVFDFANPSGWSKPAPPAEEAWEGLHLASLGREPNLCDPVFWQERTVACVVGLLYECSLREEKFLQFCRSARAQLTVTRVTEQGRVAVLPVIVHALSDLLATDSDLALLSLVAQVVPMPLRSCPALPSVNVLAVRILEHVALHLPATRLLAALIPPRGSTANALVSGSMYSALGQFEAAAYLIEGCASAVRVGGDPSAELNDGSLHYEIVCLGGDPFPAFYSISAATTRNLSPPNMYLTMIHADSNAEAAQLDAEYVRALQLSGSIREAVLHLLLRTLTPSTLCLAHQLLGLKPSIAAAAGQGGELAATALAEGCLAAVLQIMSPESCPLGSSFIQQSPDLAADCFELVYRLCASPLTSAIVLRRLGERQVDFLRVQLSLVLYLLHLGDEELLEGALDVTANLSPTLNPSYALLENVKTAICNSAAWLLKTCSLALRFADLSTPSSSTAALLRLLYRPCSALSFAAERSSSVTVLEKLLDCATSFPANIAPPLGPEMRRCLGAATTLCEVGKAGTGWGAFNKFLRSESSASASAAGAAQESLGYPLVDLRRFSALVKSAAQGGGISGEDFEAGLQSAVLANIFHKRAAANAHLCGAWCQLAGMSVTGVKARALLLQISADGDLDQAGALSQRLPAGGLAQFLFEQVFAPAANALLTRVARLPPQQGQGAALLQEHFARCQLTLVHCITASGGREGASLAPEQHCRLLQTLVQLLLSQRDSPLYGDGGDQRAGWASGSSVVCRGLLAAALTEVIKMPYRRAAALSGGLVERERERESEEDKQQDEERETGLLDALAEYHANNVEVLEQHVAAVVDALGRDAAQAGSPAVWRVSSLAALSSLFASLGAVDVFSSARGVLGKRAAGQDYRDLYGSHALVQAMQVLVRGGHLGAVLGAVGSTNSFRSEAEGEDAEDNEALFLSTLGFCVQLTSSIEGAEALLSCRVLQRLVSLPYFAHPPPLPHEIAYFAQEASRGEALQQLQARFSVAVGLLRCLFAAAPSSQAMATGAAEFLVKNQLYVSQLLRLRYPTLEGLALTEAVANLFCMVAAVPHCPLKAPRDAQHLQPSGVEEAGDVFALFGACASSFVSDICMLMSVMGADPVPSLNGVDMGLGMGGGGKSTWWEHVQPQPSSSGGLSHEQQLHRTPCSAPGLPADWSQFDEKKQRLALGTLAHAARFLRILSSAALQAPAAPQRSGALYAVSFTAVAEAFCRCAQLGLHLSDGSRGGGGGGGGSAEMGTPARGGRGEAGEGALQWLTSPLAVHPTHGQSAPPDMGSSLEAQGQGQGSRQANQLQGRRVLAASLLLVAENLVCALHNMAALQLGLSGPGAEEALSQLQRALATAEAFPAHSLVRQVARWIRDLQHA
ncbi:hypothetical protein B484DRAFT_480491 [Ochromonadaceae sp. CCMP2298]|nr:hypothetical protein B484DRAFT_480491 [Ochromonadaceae sp. CCMP2298]